MCHDSTTRSFEALVDIIEDVELLGQLTLFALQVLKGLLVPLDHILQDHPNIRIVALRQIAVISLDRGQLDLLGNCEGIAVTLARMHALNFHPRLLSGVGA
jgi:hypothetical protein